MNNEELSKEIYKILKDAGANIGTMSIPIIKSVLDIHNTQIDNETCNIQMLMKKIEELEYEVEWLMDEIEW